MPYGTSKNWDRHNLETRDRRLAAPSGPSSLHLAERLTRLNRPGKSKNKAPSQAQVISVGVRQNERRKKKAASPRGNLSSSTPRATPSQKEVAPSTKIGPKKKASSKKHTCGHVARRLSASHLSALVLRIARNRWPNVNSVAEPLTKAQADQLLEEVNVLIKRLAVAKSPRNP